MRGFDRGDFNAISFPVARELRLLGFEVAMPYYRNAGVVGALGTEQARMLLGFGFAILPIMQVLDNSLGEFTYAKGKAKGERAVVEAERCGQPRGTPIVGAVVDMDYPASELEPRLLEHVNGCIDGLARYAPLWLYGPWDVLQHAYRAWPALVGLWQAAMPAVWSGGRNASLHPAADGWQVAQRTVAGVVVDVNILRTPTGLWRAS